MTNKTEKGKVIDFQSKLEIQETELVCYSVFSFVIPEGDEQAAGLTIYVHWVDTIEKDIIYTVYASKNNSPLYMVWDGLEHGLLEENNLSQIPEILFDVLNHSSGFRRDLSNFNDWRSEFEKTIKVKK